MSRKHISCVESFKKEFSKRNALFYDCHPSSMYSSRLGLLGKPVVCNVLLGLFRIASFIFTLIIIIFQELNFTRRGYGFTFFTRWSFVFITLYFLFASMSSILYLYKTYKSEIADNAAAPIGIPGNIIENVEHVRVCSPCSGDLLSWYMKVQWVCYNIALPSSLVVTIVYWNQLYRPGSRIRVYNASTHIVNLILMLIEQYCGNIKSRVLHVYQPLIFGFIYTIFNVTIWATRGIIVYRIIDWDEDPAYAIKVIVLSNVIYIVTQPILYFISWGLHWLMCKWKV